MALIGIGIVGLVKNEAVATVIGSTAGGVAAGSAGRELQREAASRPTPRPPKKLPRAGTADDRPPRRSRPSSGPGDEIPF